MTIGEIVDILKTNGVRRADFPSDEWDRMIVHTCSVADDVASEEEIETIADGYCPEDLKRFWRLARSAKLFEDLTYHQWGVEIFSPEKTQKQTSAFQSDRSRDAAPGDLIVGKLIGDSDLLLLRTDPKVPDFGTVVLVGPIDPRIDWDTIAQTFGEFLSRYVEARGDMYWATKT